mmetsp:Transcript_17310/g.53651  ORF Transcript_17310/g.53651 Transcript_17310/m.53651 type:complete len:382 (-) Transcript_17310:138-1283(-)
MVEDEGIDHARQLRLRRRGRHACRADAVVQAQATVPGAVARAHAPERVGVPRVRVQRAKGVYKAGVKEAAHRLALLRCCARALGQMLCSHVPDVQVQMRHVEVTHVHHGLAQLLERLKVRLKVLLPGVDAIVEPLQVLARVRHVRKHQRKTAQVQRQHAALDVVVTIQRHGHAQPLMHRQQAARRLSSCLGGCIAARCGAARLIAAPGSILGGEEALDRGVTLGLLLALAALAFHLTTHPAANRSETLAPWQRRGDAVAHQRHDAAVALLGRRHRDRPMRRVRRRQLTQVRFNLGQVRLLQLVLLQAQHVWLFLAQQPLQERAPLVALEQRPHAAHVPQAYAHQGRAGRHRRGVRSRRRVAIEHHLLGLGLGLGGLWLFGG